MTVSELIIELRRFQQNYKVYIKSGNDYDNLNDEKPIDSITVISYPDNVLKGVYIKPVNGETKRIAP